MVQADGERAEIGPLDSVHLPKGTLRRVDNQGSRPAALLVIIANPPDAGLPDRAEDDPGRAALSCQPPAGAGPLAKVPPTAAARSARPASPRPEPRWPRPAAPGGAGWLTTSIRTPSPHVTLAWIAAPGECRTALVSPSCRMR